MVNAQNSLVVLACAVVTGLLPLSGHTANNTTTIVITGSVVDAPECTINGNNRIDVDFGDSVVTSLIDGSSYMEKDLVYRVSCDNPIAMLMRLSVRTTLFADFGSGLIGTNVPGLGIQLKYNGKKIEAGEYINFIYDGTGNEFPKLSAVLAANDPDTLKATDFTGTGTMVIDYQ